MSNRIDSTRFGLIRHAQTHWNLDKLIQGQKDSALTAAGQQQAQVWGHRLSSYTSHRFDRILASDLGRALSTAGWMNQFLQIPISKRSRLRELDWGAWTGKRIRDIQSETPDLLKSMEAAGWHFCPPGGESRQAVRRRAKDALQDAARKWPGQTILTVTHEGVIKCLLYGLTQRAFLPQEPAMIAPYHLHWLVVRDGKLLIERINALALDQDTESIR